MDEYTYPTDSPKIPPTGIGSNIGLFPWGQDVIQRLLHASAPPPFAAASFSCVQADSSPSRCHKQEPGEEISPSWSVSIPDSFSLVEPNAIRIDLRLLADGGLNLLRNIVISEKPVWIDELCMFKMQEHRSQNNQCY